MNEASNSITNSTEFLAAIYSLRDEKQAEHHQRFFKIGPGQYGYGDRFLGLKVPQIRAIAKQFSKIPLAEIESLLDNEWHEVRMGALFILVAKFRRAQEAERGEIIALYRRKAERINNWDLVDLSVNILGEWLRDKDRSLFYELAKSSNMWERRMAIVATQGYIKKNDIADALAIAESLLADKEDLMHKAVGWMLREVGKVNMDALQDFLRNHYSDIPRTALRYAIEHFSEEERKSWLKCSQ